VRLRLTRNRHFWKEAELGGDGVVLVCAQRKKTERRSRRAAVVRIASLEKARELDGGMQKSVLA
jgi:hypothetical protein